MIDFDKLLKKWQIWIAFVLFLIPGTVYQLYYKTLDWSTYSSTFIIAFLIAAFYYSLPFILLGMYFYVTCISNGKGFNRNDLFVSAVYCAFIYGIAQSIQVFSGYPFIYGTGIMVILIIGLSFINTLIQAVKSLLVRIKKHFKSKKR